MIEIGKQYLLKTKEQLIEEYGISYNGTPNVIYGINSSMCELLGKLVTVSHIWSEGLRLNLEEDIGNWTWHPDWFILKTEKGNTLN